MPPAPSPSSPSPSLSLTFGPLELEPSKQRALHVPTIVWERTVVRSFSRSRIRSTMGALSIIVVMALALNIHRGMSIPHDLEASEDKADKTESADFAAGKTKTPSTSSLTSSRGGGWGWSFSKTTGIAPVSSTSRPSWSSSSSSTLESSSQTHSNSLPSHPANVATPTASNKNSTNPYPNSITLQQHQQQQKQYNPPPSLDGDHAKTFVDRWCDLDGVQWFPTAPDKAWQLRAPYFLIPGAKYSGTSVLSALLLQQQTTTTTNNTSQTQQQQQHPLIVPPLRSAELGFFRETSFRRYVTVTGQRTKVFAARARMYARDYPASILQQHAHIISFDATPGYLFYSSLIPRRILCVMPWIKIVVLLRNPVDRLYHQYVAAKRHGWKTEMDEWIAQDQAILLSVGLVRNNTNNTSNITTAIPLDISKSTEQEDRAWYQYQITSNKEGAIGRSLYDIQLRQWFRAMVAAGKKPADNVLIVWTERLQTKPVEELKRIFQFLDLPESSIVIPSNLSSRLATPPNAIPTNLRQQLEEFFRPYNERLEALLQQYGVDNGRGESSTTP